MDFGLFFSLIPILVLLVLSAFFSGSALHIDPESPEPLKLSNEHRIPATINRYLREYQRDGVRFLYRQYSAGIGGILGDDMGLGKTVQVISFIAAILGKTGLRADIMKQKPSFIRKVREIIIYFKGKRNHHL